ncbi:hypothetical protein QVD17_42412 [Tagetes erecta]|uniref:Uncharacterized protein n=1 Tax=Tagetes erecta TaxID=13708 RepID=A0AAD8JL80_TARER|nr:hypothetical protein QVD17_42480 [Tagetes erecta]KAK1405899.1 hypothetical protein QVD17_42412 [Tagetes erecta]
MNCYNVSLLLGKRACRCRKEASAQQTMNLWVPCLVRRPVPSSKQEGPFPLSFGKGLKAPSSCQASGKRLAPRDFRRRAMSVVLNSFSRRGIAILGLTKAGNGFDRAARSLVFVFLSRPAIPAESSLRLDGRITVDSDRRRGTQSGLSMKKGRMWDHS